MSSQRRVRWEAVRADTGQPVGLAYYQAPSAFKAAREAAAELKVPIVVERDGEPYRTFEPPCSFCAPDEKCSAHVGTVV